MFGFLYVFLAVFLFSVGDILYKKPIVRLGVNSAILIRYIFASIISLIAVLVFSKFILIPFELLPLLIFEIIIGAVAIYYFFKALEKGLMSIIVPFSHANVIISILIALLFFNETLNFYQVIGGLIVIGSTIFLAINKLEKFKFEKGIKYALITFLGWGIFFALLKPLNQAINPFNTVFLIEVGILFCLIIVFFFKKEKIKSEKNSSIMLLFSAIIITIAGLAFNFSILEIGVSLTAIVMSSVSAMIAILSRIFLKEKISTKKYFGIALIIIGLIILNIPI